MLKIIILLFCIFSLDSLWAAPMQTTVTYHKNIHELIAFSSADADQNFPIEEQSENRHHTLRVIVQSIKKTNQYNFQLFNTSLDKLILFTEIVGISDSSYSPLLNHLPPPFQG